jgi:6-phospho-beta-glucosidase
MEMPHEQDNSVTGEGVATMIAAMATGRRMICIANIANQGAITNLPATAEVEVEAVTDSAGVRPLVMGEAPPLLKALLERRFVWQELVADAAVSGNRVTALQALMMDEMAILPEKAEKMLDELLAASRDLLPQFFPKKARTRDSTRSTCANSRRCA